MKRKLQKLIVPLVVLLVVVLSYGAFSRFYNRHWDLTRGKRFSLSAVTLKVLDELKKSDKHVKVTLVFQLASDPKKRFRRQQLLDLLDEYHIHAPKNIASPEVIDPRSRPAEMARLDIKLDDTLVLEAGNKPLLLPPYELWEMRPGEGTTVQENFIAEAAITSALKKQIDQRERFAYFISGHGEAPIESDDPTGLKIFADALHKQNVRLANLNLGVTGKVPDNADLIVLGRPVKTLLPAEDQLLTQYAANGGRLLILAEFNVDLGLPKLFTELGVELGNNLIIEPEKAFQGVLVSPIPNYGNHAIVAELKALGENSLLSTVRSVERGFGNTQGIATFDLLMTSNRAWAEANYASKEKMQYNEKSHDIKGPVTMALAVQHPLTKNAATPRETRAVIFGDGDFALNDLIRFGANKDLLLNSTSWIIGGEEGLAITPRSPEANLLVLTYQQVWGLFAGVVLIVPGTVLGLGSAVWWRRRAL